MSITQEYIKNYYNINMSFKSYAIAVIQDLCLKGAKLQGTLGMKKQC